MVTPQPIRGQETPPQENPPFAGQFVTLDLVNSSPNFFYIGKFRNAENPMPKIELWGGGLLIVI